MTWMDILKEFRQKKKLEYCASNSNSYSSFFFFFFISGVVTVGVIAFLAFPPKTAQFVPIILQPEALIETLKHLLHSRAFSGKRNAFCKKKKKFYKMLF